MMTHNSLVLKTSSMRVFLAYMTHLNLDIHQMDVQTTFLNAEFKEKIFMELPPGPQVIENSNFVCKLNKSLYGLKQSSYT
jgi:ATP-binding cassette subfamily B (MDR/TAP) protein 1